MHADDLANPFRYFYNPPKFSYGMCLNIFGKKKKINSREKKKRKDLKSVKSVSTERVDGDIPTSSPGRCVCRVFLFSDSCGRFSSFARPFRVSAHRACQWWSGGSCTAARVEAEREETPGSAPPRQQGEAAMFVRRKPPLGNDHLMMLFLLKPSRMRALS